MNENQIQTEENLTDKWYSPLMKVTPLSKYLALLVFITLPFLGFMLGLNYGSTQTKNVDVISESTNREETFIQTVGVRSDNVSEPYFVNKLPSLYKSANQKEFISEEEYTYSLVQGGIIVQDKDGVLIWKNSDDYYERISIQGDALYAATITKGGLGGFYAFDRYSGDLLWEKDVSAEHIIVDEDSVFVNDNGIVRVLDGESGEELWSFAKGLDGHVPIITPVRFIGDTVYVGSSDSNIYMLNKTDGSIVNQFTFGPEFPGDVYIAGEYVLILSRGVEVRNKNNNSLLYTIDNLWIGNPYHDSVAVKDDVLYALNYYDFDNYLVAYSLADGKEIWKTEISFPQTFNKLYVANGKVYMVTLTNIDMYDNTESYDVHVFNQATGAFIETIKKEVK